MLPIELAKRLALLLLLAFFLGLAFEEVYKRDEPTIPGGIRTFPLVGLAGAMLYLVEPHWALAFVAGVLALAAWLYAFLRFQRPPEGGSGRTLVIPVCNLLIYVLGPIALTQPPWVAIGVTVATVLVIGTRERMHSFARLIPQAEVLTAGKFLILVGIILPLIPDTRLIATAPVTPYHIWLAVIAISGTASIRPQGEEGPQVGRGWSELPVDRPPCRAQQEHGRSNPATRACCEPMKASVTVPKIVTS